MIETNLLGAITTTEVFLDQLRRRRRRPRQHLLGGRPHARPFNAVYAATKWGMNGWSESLRQQLQPEVRVIVIEPGVVATELHRPHHPRRDEGGRQGVLRGPSEPRRDIAEIVAFSVSRPHSVSLNEILVRPTAQAM